MHKYDYIIIGAGSAGCVLANRLTEDPNVSVLVLEAGGRDSHPFLRMPIAHAKVARWLRYSWMYQTEPEPALNGRSLPLPRGKTLGGSSSINGMIYIRGNPRDYDLWRQRGLDGWSYADVLPYFKRLESSWRGDSAYHSSSGPVKISPVEAPQMMFETLAGSAEKAGHRKIDDPFAGAQEGISRTELTVGDGMRQSTAQTYLRPAMRRPNLTVETGALIKRVVVDRGRAVGVSYRQGRQAQHATANREVILTAGSYGSPQILLLSGIGPAAHLRETGIDVAHDLPGVGQNLSEHPIVHMSFKLKSTDTFTQHFRLDRATLNVLRWRLLGSGPFATNGAYANVFLRTDPRLDRPDVQMICAAIGLDVALWFPGLTPPPIHRLSCSPCLLHAESRGFVKLRSADPADHPRIFFNMLGERSDMETMIKAMKKVREIYLDGPMGQQIERSYLPSDDVRTDAQIEAYLRQNAMQVQHPVGTCAMGVGADAVVDAQLRVRGVAGLRVVDSSVMPDEPSGNTNIPTIMIAEKAADMIRGRAPLAPAEL